MKNRVSVIRFFCGFIFIVLLSLFFTEIAFSQVQVRGYFRKDGTFVRPHIRTAPDGIPYNNYSFPGNYNPNTGKITPGSAETYLRNYYNRSRSSTSNTNATSRFQSYFIHYEYVKSVQTALSLTGYYSGSIDGVFDSQTESALNRFQRQYQLNITDHISDESIDKLIDILESYSSTNSKSPYTFIPQNASLNMFGDGWVCNRGYRKINDGCERVAIPQNASLNMFGDGWVCNSGYRKINDGCERVAIPQNASLNMFGDGWVCNNGYRKIDGGCERVAIPQNASLNIFGDGWVCNSGYRRVNNKCISQ